MRYGTARTHPQEVSRAHVAIHPPRSGVPPVRPCAVADPAGRRRRPGRPARPPRRRRHLQAQPRPDTIAPRPDGTADRIIGGDELGNLLDALPANEVLVLLDCCHATSGVKSLGSRTAARSFLLPTPVGMKGLPPRARDVTTPSMARALLAPRPKQQRALLFACTAAQNANEISHADLHPAAPRDRPDVNPDQPGCGAFTYCL